MGQNPNRARPAPFDSAEAGPGAAGEGAEAPGGRHRLVAAFTDAVAALSRLSGVAAAGLIVAAVLVVCQMVFVRYVLGQSTVWQTEFVTYALIAATFIGSPYVLLTRGHVNVDLLPLYIHGRARYALALFAAAASFLFCLVLTWQGAELWYEAYTLGWRSETIWAVRLWIPYAAMPVGIGLLTLQYVADIANLLTGREPPFGIQPADRRQEDRP